MVSLSLLNQKLQLLSRNERHIQIKKNVCGRGRENVYTSLIENDVLIFKMKMNMYVFCDIMV